MITQTTFFGLPLRTRRQRRLLVLLYYLLFGCMASLFLWRSHGTIAMGLIPQTLVLGGLLGGINIGGPVRLYADRQLPSGPTGPLQTLNLAGRKPFDTLNPAVWTPLDERERLQRDFAHYTAYRILRWTLGFVCFFYWLTLYWSEAWLSTKGPVLAWTLLIYVLSLPQSVLLWTEPNAPTADLLELPASNATS